MSRRIWGISMRYSVDVIMLTGVTESIVSGGPSVFSQCVLATCAMVGIIVGQLKFSRVELVGLWRSSGWEGGIAPLLYCASDAVNMTMSLVK